MFHRVVAGLLLVGGFVALLRWSQLASSEVTVSGFIEADEIRLGSRIGGRVQRVHVDEGMRVAQGDLLVELEPFDLQERRAQAEAFWRQSVATHERLTGGFRAEEIAQTNARYRQMVAQHEKLQNGPRKQEIEAAQADLEFAQAELILAQEVHRRTQQLRSDGASTDEQLDRAVKELHSSEARVQARHENLALLKEGTRPEDLAAVQAQVDEAEQAWLLTKNGYRSEEIEEAYAAMQAARSALDVIERQIEELRIVAPMSGTIEVAELQPGDLVAPNAPVLSMIDESHLWIRTYVPENRLNLSLGQQLPVTVDSFPNEVFHGEVTFIARQAEFTPSNIQTPEERSQQVFRIKVTLIEGLDRLRPGMAGDVWLEGTP